MSRRTSGRTAVAKRSARRPRSPEDLSGAGRTAIEPCTVRPTRDVMREVNRLLAALGRDACFRRQVAEFATTTLVLSATDTGRELAVVLGEQGVRAHPYEGEPFDVKIRATESVHQAVLYGELDPDAAFFAGRVRICGCLLTAFRVKNRFLGFVQQHLGRGLGAADGSTLNPR